MKRTELEKKLKESFKTIPTGEKEEEFFKWLEKKFKSLLNEYLRYNILSFMLFTTSQYEAEQKLKKLKKARSEDDKR